MTRARDFCAALIMCVGSCGLALADTTVFFEACQSSMLISSGVTSDTIVSNGYLFTFTRDKLFTGGTGHPIGRPVRVAWPVGVEAQAVTTPPPGNTDYHARITLQRADGLPFDLTAFTAMLLANTAGAGGSIEIMPVLNGDDGFADPIPFDATGYYGQTFHYDRSPNPWGSTALLTGFEAYKIALYVDFAFVAITLDSAAPGLESCCLPGPSCADLTSIGCVQSGGFAQGSGTSCSCNPCSAAPAPPPAPDGSQGTIPLHAARLSAEGNAIEVGWDATSCPAADYNLIHGHLSEVASYALTGAVCSIGTTGSYLWDPAPGGNVYFLIVGTDGAGTESSWGLDSSGTERNGLAPSGACGTSLKDASRTCP